MARSERRSLAWLGLVLLLGTGIALWLVRLERVQLRTGTGSPQSLEASLWIVDEGLFLWLEAPGPDAAWYRALLADPLVEVERGGHTQRFRAEVMPDQAPHVERLYREKYGLAHWLRGWLRDPERLIAIRLARLPDAGTRA